VRQAKSSGTSRDIFVALRKRFERWCLARTSNPVRTVATWFWRVRFPSASAITVDADALRRAKCAAGGSPLYSRVEAARILRVSPNRLRTFERMDLVRPATGPGENARFDFRDLLSLRALVALLDRGVPMRRIRRSVERVRARWPELERPLGALRLEDGCERLVVRHGGERLDPDGQLLLDFGGAPAGEPTPVAELPAAAAGPRTALEWFERGCQLDIEDGTLVDAIEAYRRALELDPTLADAHCNLGTAYYNRGDREAARASYEAAIAQIPAHREANFNLGNLLEEAGRREAAIHHYKRAVTADPCFADAQLNLALLYEKIGAAKRGREHWRRYLQLAPDGTWAEVARQRLRQTPAPASAETAESE
jgi:tetratricopeptide (TPR) repeat protein